MDRRLRYSRHFSVPPSCSSSKNGTPQVRTSASMPVQSQGKNFSTKTSAAALHRQPTRKPPEETVHIATSAGAGWLPWSKVKGQPESRQGSSEEVEFEREMKGKRGRFAIGNAAGIEAENKAVDVLSREPVL